MNNPRQRLIVGPTDEEISDAEYIDEQGRTWGSPEGPTDEELAYAKFRAEMSDSQQLAKLSVYAQPTDSMGRSAQRGHDFLFDCDLDEYEFTQLLAKLRDEYGSGRYRLIARDGNGAYLFNRGVTVRAPKPKPSEPGTNPQPNASDMFDRFARIMDQQEQRMEARMQRFMGNNKSGGMFGDGSSMENFAMMFGMVQKMAEIFSGNSKPIDIVKEFQRMAELRDTMRGMFDLDGGGGGKGLHDTMTEALKIFGPMLVEGAKQTRQGPPRRDPARLESPQAQPQPRKPNPSERPAMTDEQKAFAQRVNLLVNLAAAGTNPETIADSVLDQTTDDDLPALKAFVEAPDVLEKMAAINPAVNQFSQWFATLRDSLRDYFQNEYLQSEPDGDTLAPSDASPDESGEHVRTDASDT